MSRISFATANYVARQLGYNMTEGWGQGERAANDYYKPIATFRDRFNELLGSVRAMGFEAADLWTAHLNWSWATPEHVAIAVELLRTYNLRVASLAGGFGATPQEFESACKLAVGVQTQILGGRTTLLATDREAVVALLKQYGVKLAIENHPEKTPEEMLAKIGDGGQGTIGTAVDTGWYGTKGCDAAQAVRKLGKHILHVHLKDVFAVGKHDTCRYGRGCVPVGACVQALEAMHYQGGYSVEHEPENGDPTNDCKACLAMLRGWLPGELKLPANAKRLGVGVVGCGNIAEAYFQCLMTDPKIRVIGAADKDMPRAKKAAAQYGLKAYRSLGAMLADPAIELVVNLTIHHAHRKVVTQCLNAGKHVHSEKPLALKYREAKALVELAQEKGLRLGCSPFTFMGEAQQTAWKFVREGKLGTVRVAYAEANWGRIESWHPAPKAFYEVGPLFDVGVYPLTFLTAMFGPARRVWAYGKVLLPDRLTRAGAPFHIETPDFVVTMVELANGPLVRLTTNFYVQGKQTGLELHGDLGSLHLEWYRFQGPLEFAEYGKPYAAVPLVKEPYRHVDWGRAVSDMAEAIAQNRPHRATGEQAAHVVEICCAAQQSLKRNKPVKITSSFMPPEPMEWAK